MRFSTDSEERLNFHRYSDFSFYEGLKKVSIC